MRSREVVSRQVHTLKIAGANPASAIVLPTQNTWSNYLDRVGSPACYVGAEAL